MLPSQLRIYKIKPGQMDNWLRFFHEKVVPLQSKFGISPMVGWVNAADSEYIWARDFAAGEPIEDQEKRYATSEERRTLMGDEAKQYIESMAVRVVELNYQRD